jgi:hypothetical protein
MLKRTLLVLGMLMVAPFTTAQQNDRAKEDAAWEKSQADAAEARERRESSERRSLEAYERDRSRDRARDSKPTDRGTKEGKDKD